MGRGEATGSTGVGPARGGSWDPWSVYAERLPGWAGLFLPLVLAPAPVLVAAFVRPGAVAEVWSLVGAAVAGLQFAVPLGIAYRFPPWTLLGVVLWVQFLFLAWIVRNVELLRRWRKFDAFLRRKEEAAARTYAHHHWLRRFHFLGLIVFIFLPVGSGLLTGVFVGKLTGMSDRRLVAAIFLGTLLWAVVLVFVGDVIGDAIRRAL